MIRAVFRPPYRLTVSGHARYGPAGKDIVCAAASVLWYTLCEVLDNAKDEGHGTVTYGKNTVAYTPNDGTEVEVAAVFRAIWRGYLLLAAQYGNYITAREEDGQ